jgi:F0F1-type ATP synthase assembly protein I
VNVRTFITWAAGIAALLLAAAYLISRSGAYAFGALAGGLLVGWLPANLAYWAVYARLRDRIPRLMGSIMGSMFGKMILGIAAIVAVAMLARPQLAPFAVSFLVSYFIFTAFEVYGLMTNLRTPSEKK